jgi:hypothetical protein
MSSAVATALASAAFAATIPVVENPGDTPETRPATKPAYLFNVSNLQGDVASSFASIAYDRKNDELYVVSPDARFVRIYNDAGMEIHRFGGDSSVGWVRSVAPLDNGDIVALSRFEGGNAALVRCDYRGKFLERMNFEGIPPSFAGFSPDSVHAANGKLYLLDSRAMKVVAADYDGKVFATYDLKALVFGKGSEALADYDKEKNADEEELQGFGVDRNGNLLFTIPTMFRAFVVSPDKKLRSFGQKGSRPGKFNIVGPITADEQGYLYVADMLRCVVLVFDEQLRFIWEFAGRGLSPGRLVLPTAIATGNGKVFVSQGRNRGVSVYRVRPPQ